jgi:phosphatidylinositol glycan class N
LVYIVLVDEKLATELFFKPFGPLSKHRTPEAMIHEVERLIDAEEYETAEKLCLDLIDLSLQGLRYFQTYDWLFLRSIITLGYIGWCLFGLEFVIRTYVYNGVWPKHSQNADALVSRVF